MCHRRLVIQGHLASKSSGLRAKVGEVIYAVGCLYVNTDFFTIVSVTCCKSTAIVCGKTENAECGKKRPNGESGTVGFSVVSGEWIQKSIKEEASESVA